MVVHWTQSWEGPSMDGEHPVVALARRTVEQFVRDGTVARPPQELSEDMAKAAGAFVSLHRQGQLRGCIGTIEPVRPTVAEEVIGNAISAASRDPRFPPLRAEELDDLDISVDVLGEPQRIASMDELDPRRYGVIVELGGRRGLLLPDLEGVDTPEQQVGIALRKAWISPDEPYSLYRFEVTRYH
jgi:AmmeMemoRadiSam system protein A